LEECVQLLNGGATFGREHGQKLLQFLVVEPQPVAAWTSVEGQGRGAGVFELDFAQGRIAARAKMGMILRFDARLVQEFQQGTSGLRARAFHDRLQFARLKPYTAAAMTEIDFEVAEMQDE
jgi:hypothetical protein